MAAANVHRHHRRSRDGGRGGRRHAAHPRPAHPQRRKLGDSIAINGVDLTVAEMDGECFFANLMPETYRRSNLGELKAGDLVNLERSVPPDRPAERPHRPRRGRRASARCTRSTPEAEAIIVRVHGAARAAALHGGQGAGLHRRHQPDDRREGRESFSVSLVQYTQEHTNLVAAASRATGSTSRPTSSPATSSSSRGTRGNGAAR